MNLSLLLKKLYALGIVDQEYEWFTDYPKGRSQVVGFQGARSDSESICLCVLKGSILGRLLFVLHVNDFPTVARKCNMLMALSYSILQRSLLHSRKVSMKILTEAICCSDLLLLCSIQQNAEQFHIKSA